MENEIKKRIENYNKHIQWCREEEQEYIERLKRMLAVDNTSIAGHLSEIENAGRSIRNTENEIEKLQIRVQTLENLIK